LSAAELAEMLATDLQKEGLRGRTLTLKLKTASFEVHPDVAFLVAPQKKEKRKPDMQKHTSI